MTAASSPTVFVSSVGEPLGSARRGRAIALGAALLIGVNLRPSITSTAALLAPAAERFDLTPTQTSLLATLPIIAFGVSAPIGPFLARRRGTAEALMWIMLALAGALVLRVTVPGGLLVGTFVAGLAIMAGGTLLPQYLKSLRASGLWIGLSTMSFSAGAAIGAGLTVPVHALTESPAVALGAWALPAVLAAAAMALVARRRSAGAPPSVRVSVSSSSLTTVSFVTAMFGLQAMLFFAVAAWLPRMLGDRGVDPQTAGGLLALVNVAGLVPTLLAPIAARRRRLLRALVPVLGAVMLGAFAWLSSGAGSPVAMAVTLGAVQSAVFGLSLALIVILAEDEASAGLLSAVAQGVGYAFAGAGSLLVGILRDVTGSWTPSLVLMIGCALALSVIMGFVVRRHPVDLRVHADAPASARA
ncbi:MFS transporter [Microbacterium sp. NPDC089695]|uniref:MFS transporter n=1 Tax=Microbacterium sp. NPDC089695 TaxID=3364198 RepID=UPI0038048812